MTLKRIIDTPVGPLTLEASAKGMRSIEFEEKKIQSPRVKRILRARSEEKLGMGQASRQDARTSLWSDQELRQAEKILDQCEKELGQYFSGKRMEFEVPIDLVGTDFQKRVWKSLCRIGYGETQSYLAQATGLKSPKSVRAVAGANGKNPLPILLPCHRVVASSGHLHGFGGGLPLKKKLLAIEGVQMNGMRVE